MKDVHADLLQVISAMAVSAENGLQLPALILAYSTIDAMGWLGAEPSIARGRHQFVWWCDTYLLPANQALKCSALELYAARCGILHTFTGESDLGARPEVRHIVYSWGRPAHLQKLERIVERVGDPKYVAVHLNDLTDAIRLGVAQMFEDAQREAVLARRIAERGARYFDHLDGDAFDQFLE